MHGDTAASWHVGNCVRVTTQKANTSVGRKGVKVNATKGGKQWFAVGRKVLSAAPVNERKRLEFRVAKLSGKFSR
jgi:hypothetical protein